jgi:hypothetical protein
MRADNTRRLKVYYGHHSNSFKPQPMIRLLGSYLAKADFKIGDMIHITLEKGSINITKNPNPTINNV